MSILSLQQRAREVDAISFTRTLGRSAYTAFELVYGRDRLLPIDLSLASWRLGRRDKGWPFGGELDERVLMESRAAAELERSRKGNKSYYDQRRRDAG